MTPQDLMELIKKGEPEFWKDGPSLLKVSQAMMQVRTHEKIDWKQLVGQYESDREPSARYQLQVLLTMLERWAKVWSQVKYALCSVKNDDNLMTVGITAKNAECSGMSVILMAPDDFGTGFFDLAEELEDAYVGGTLYRVLPKEVIPMYRSDSFRPSRAAPYKNSIAPLRILGKDE